jgi:hypothetical protein
MLVREIFSAVQVKRRNSVDRDLFVIRHRTSMWLEKLPRSAKDSPFGRKDLEHLEDSPTAAFSLGVEPLLTDEEIASILRVATEWVRSHATEIPGFQRLGMYYRFHPPLVRDWLGSLDPLMKTEAVAAMLRVPPSWVYANGEQLTGFLRLGRYIRFRPMAFRGFLQSSGACQ